jgi:hypothetical protein
MTDWKEKARRRLRIEVIIGGSTPMNAFDQLIAVNIERKSLKPRERGIVYFSNGPKTN